MGLLDGKNAIITGSARGIGRATAELFVSEGARVLINDIDGDVAEQAASEIDGETAVFSGDLTEPGVPDELVKKAIDEFGEVDILVNNAGYTWDGVAHKMTDEQFQAMLDIHTVAPFRLCPRDRSPLARGRQGREGRGRRALPQAREHLVHLGHDGQRRPGQLLGRQVGDRRHDQDARQGVGRPQDQRERGRVRLRRDAPDPGEGEPGVDRARRREDRPRHPGSDARHGRDDHPARPPGHSPRRRPARCSSSAPSSRTTSTARR